MIFILVALGFVFVFGCIGHVLASIQESQRERDDELRRIRRELHNHEEDEWWDIEENWK